MAMLSEKLWTVPEVAERLRCSRWGVYALVRDRRLLAVRLTNRLLFTERAVEDAIQEATQREGATVG
jgi:excisionase family DNA binding protein